MTATVHKLPTPQKVKGTNIHPSFVLTDAGFHPPDEVLFLAVCKYFYAEGSEMVADDLIVRLVWEWSGIEPAQWDEAAFLLECQKLYRLAKSACPRKRDLFARVIVQLIRDLMASLVLTEIAK